MYGCRRENVGCLIRCQNPARLGEAVVRRDMAIWRQAQTLLADGKCMLRESEVLSAKVRPTVERRGGEQRIGPVMLCTALRRCEC